MSSESSRSEVRIVLIDAGHAGRRIDNYLLNALGKVPKTHVYRLLRRGEVRVNGGRVQPNYRLQEGDKLRIPPLRLPDPGDPAPAPSATLRREVTASVIQECEYFLALNKPAGIAVHSGSGISNGVIEAIRTERADVPYLELVHRLDRGTSGCLLLAKDPRFLRGMHDLIRNGAVEKRYYALVGGCWRGGERVLAAALLSNRLRGGERVVQTGESGKQAVTIAAAKEVFADCSLLDIRILTGRTHQIRVHLADAGFPIVGDEKYGDAGINKRLREIGVRQMFLHAYELRFRDPLTGESRQVRCALHAGQEAALHALRSRMQQRRQ